MKILTLILTVTLWFSTAPAQEQKPAAGDTAAQSAKPRPAVKVDSADFYFAWAKALCDSANYRMAVLKFKRAVIIRHNFPEAWTEWGVALANLGRTEEEIAKYQEAIKIDSGFGDAYFNWGTTLTYHQQFKEAADIFKKGIAAAPKFPKNYEGLGKVQNLTGFYSEAVKSFEKTLELNPANPWALFWQSGCLARLKKKTESLAALEKAIQWGGDYYKMEAQKDGAFNSLWSDPDFRKIIGL
ncbi:MAG TPA: tetratricopeptide repeat protein [candidate division Zixibacteria bacterium]|nr:tetratricopeptide repeat protein [candidate division Zixibacteria bacterium]